MSCIRDFRNWVQGIKSNLRNGRGLRIHYLAAILCIGSQLIPLSQVFAQALGSDSYTTFTATTDTVKIYVASDSDGNDSNNGLSPASPVRSLQRGYDLLRDGHADWLLLKKGNTWNSERFPQWAKGGPGMTGSPGGSVAGVMMIGAYGSGARPVVRPNNTNGLSVSDTSKNLAIVGINFFQTNYTGNNTEPGIFLFNATDRAGFQNFIIEDCQIQNFRDGIVIERNQPNDPVISIRNVYLRLNVINHNWAQFINGNPSQGPHSQGLFMSNTGNWIIEGNVFDDNGHPQASGYASNGTIFRHNIYVRDVSSSGIVRNNILSRASATGLSTRSGGTLADNLMILNPIAMFLGTSSVEQASVNEIRGNVVLHTRTINPVDERGIGLDIVEPAGTQVTYNIFANARDVSTQYNVFGFGRSLANSLLFEKNIVYNWKNANPNGTSRAGMIGTGSGIFRNNDLQQVNGGELLETASSAYSYSGNRYFTTNPAGQQGLSPGGTFARVNYPNPNPDNVDLEHYMASLGFPVAEQTREKFFERITSQSKDTFDPRFTAAIVNCWVQAQFGMPYRSCGANGSSSSAMSSSSSVASSASSIPSSSSSSSSAASSATPTPTPTITPTIPSGTLGGTFGSVPNPYLRGSGISIPLTVSGPVSQVVFQTWSNTTNSLEAIFIDNQAPFAYPASALNLVSLGSAQVQAVIQSASVPSVTVVAPFTVFAEQVVSSSSSSSAQSSVASSSSSSVASSSSSSTQSSSSSTGSNGPLQTITLAVRRAATNEGSSTPGVIRLKRPQATSASLVVRYSVTGSAQMGLDYQNLSGSATIPSGRAYVDVQIRALRDNLIEPDETVRITIVPNGTLYQVGSPATGAVTIRNVGGTVRSSLLLKNNTTTSGRTR